MQRPIVFALLLCVFSFSNLLGQAPDSTNLLDLIEKGDKLFSRGNYEDALKYFQWAEIASKDDLTIEKRIGVTLVKLELYDRALPYLDSLQSKSDSTDIYLTYCQGLSLHHLGHYQKAMHKYQFCLDYMRERSIDTGIDDLVKRIRQCEFWQKIRQNPLDVEITRLDSGFNTIHSEYGAKLSPDMSQILFTRRIKNSEILPKAKEAIYVSEFDSGRWQPGKAIKELNYSQNNAILGFSANGRIAYFFADQNQGDIMQAKYDSGQWQSFSPLRGEINTDFTENAFTVTENGHVAYFVSNRTDLDHQGGKDIYSAIFDEQKGWWFVKNLGPQINSGYDEDFVFWNQEDTTLYFSSNRENSVGGYDIFYCKVDQDGQFLAPKNLGLPVNTPYNDISYFKKGDKAWYATHYSNNREDIFEIDFGPEPLDPFWYQQPLAGIEPIDQMAFIEHIYFRSGQYQVAPGDPEVSRLAAVLKSSGGARIRLSGHSDWIGDERVNDELSFLRTLSVATELVRQGVDPKILSLDFYGEQELLTDTTEASNLQAQQLNRCVRITVEQQGMPYLYVQSDQQQDQFEITEDALKAKQFFVMLYVSKVPVRKFERDPEVKLGYNDKAHLQYYYVGPFSEPMQAFEALKLQQENNEKAYVYYREMRIDDATEIQVTFE